MRRAHAIRLLLAGALALAAALVALSGPGQFLQRWSIDALLWLRHGTLGPAENPVPSPVVLVVIDEETHGTAPFDLLPEVAWTPQLGRVIDGIGAAGALAVGLDVVYPKTLEAGGLVRGHDRPLLKALQTLGREGRVVLGQVNASRQVIAPEPRQVMMAGGSASVKTLQLVTDADNVVREHLGFRRDTAGEAVTTFAGELAGRAGAAVPERFLIDYNTAPQPFPVYSLADIHGCLEAGRQSFLDEAFRGRIVLIGSALDVEDRRVPARQFLDNRYQGPSARCLERPAEAARYGDTVDRRTIPGVFIQAAAVSTLLRGQGPHLVGPVAAAAVAFAWTGLAALVFLNLGPALGLVSLMLLLATAVAVSLHAFVQGWVLPAALLVGATPLAAGAAYLLRFVEELRARRRSERAKAELSSRFGRYLAPAIIARLETDPKALRLGGERREVTVMFSDIVGYTTISERLQAAPEQLVDVVNGYFTLMVEIVERHGGYVDKFIGDCVMAVWGAPLEQPDQAVRAVEAALECMDALEDFNRDVVAARYGLPPLGARIGINTGPAIVGNMGGPTRFNYTVTGDTVNLASRLEGANKVYGTSIIVGPETAAAVGEAFVLRRLDLLVVKGKTRPVQVSEVLAPSGNHDEARSQHLLAFEQALTLYSARSFEAAVPAFERLAGSDPVALLYAGRCRHFLQRPPPPDWDGSFENSEK